MDEIKKENFNSDILPNITHGENKPNITEKVRKNPWIVSSLILGAIILVFVVGNVFGMTGFSFTGKVVSGNDVGNNLISYLNSKGGTYTFDSVKTVSGVYEVTIDDKGQKIPLYVTKDGNFIQQGYPLVSLSTNADTNSQTDTQTNIPKTDKPSVELYVFAYCPYGLQMEKAMIPVVKLLGNKIDFKIKQIGAMHGDFEKVEAQRQLCIEKNYPDKFLDYVLAFAEDTSCPNGAATCIDAKLKTLYTKFGFDASKINSCMTSQGETLYNAEVSNANSNGVSGSPTLKINGVDSQVSRSPEAILTGVCSAFNNAPSECSQTLSTTQASAGFGAGAGSANSNVQCAT